MEQFLKNTTLGKLLDKNNDVAVKVVEKAKLLTPDAMVISLRQYCFESALVVDTGDHELAVLPAAFAIHGLIDHMNEMEDSDPSLSMKRVFLDPILSHAIPLLDFAKTDTLESVIKNLCEKRWQWGGVFVDDQMSDFRIMNPRILLQMMLKFNYELVMGWLQQFSVSDLPPSKDQRWHASWQLLHESNSAMTGFKKLDAHQVNACAIVDKNSRLSANLSVSDFPGLQKNQSQYPSSTFSGYSVEKLKFQVLMYIQAMYDGVIPTPVTCHADTKLGNLCQHMLNEHHHQVWLVDDDERPIGVVQLWDILHMF